MALDIPINRRLQSQSTAFGFWLTLPSAAAARGVLRTGTASSGGGFSWVLIDAEHGLITDSDYYTLVTAIGSEGASPIIRVPNSEEWMIKRALDAGAHGILTPMCHTVEDATRIVKYSKYPPRGTRGYGPAFASHAFPGSGVGPQYDLDADDNLVVMVQIESKQGVENVEAIAQVDGIDVLLIGPFDLAKQMNVVRGGPEHEAAIQRTLRAAKAAGKKAGIFCTSGTQARERAEQGFDVVSIMPDMNALTDGMLGELYVACGKVKQEPKPDSY